MKLTVVGKNTIRVDGASKVTGRAIYPQDIYMDGMLFGKTLRSTKPHAYIKVDTSKAEKLDGVIEVLTYKDVPGNNSHGVLFKDHEVFCEEKVRRIGDPIAFVVAKSEEIATRAVKLIEVTYDEIEAIFDPMEAMKESSPKVHCKNNIVYHYKIRKGNYQDGFKECDVIVENTYKTSMVDHAFLQPEAGIAYLENDGTLVVCASTQYPHFDQIEIAEAVGMPMEKVKVINPAVGGAFGGREDITLQIHLAIAAKTTGRPVKAIYTREESFEAHCKRHSITMKYKTGADKNGKILAMEAEIIGDTGAYASWAVNVLRKAGVHATGPYEIPNVKVDSYAVYTNNPFAGAMRGFGATQPPVAYEQQIDELARMLNIDPIDMRMRNIFRVGSETATGQILEESVPLERCILEAARKMESKDTLEKDSRKKRGIGIGSVFYGTGYGNGFPDISRAKAELQRNGQVKIYVGATEVGQGAKTILTQIGAEGVGQKTEDVILICEDTSITPDSGTAAASRQTYNTGNAIKKATEGLKEKIIEKAVRKLGINSEAGLVIKEGIIHIKTLPDKQISFKEIAEEIKGELLTSEGIFTAHTTEMDLETGQGAPYWPYTFGACSVEVGVDTETGIVEILRGAVAQDVGKAVNPHLIEGQIDGGFAMAMGYGLLEDIDLNRGRIGHNRFSNYLIPTALDMVDIEKIIIEDPESTGPYGAKGIGEPVMIPVTPAILNAIYDAVGVRMTEIPVTPQKLLKVLRKSEGGIYEDKC